MKIKKNDKIKMLSGKDRGKTGKVIFISNKDEKNRKMIVEGLNFVKRHQKPKKQGQKGQIISVERLVSASAVQLVCPHCGKPARVGFKIEGKNKIRVCKKCKAAI